MPLRRRHPLAFFRLAPAPEDRGGNPFLSGARSKMARYRFQELVPASVEFLRKGYSAGELFRDGLSGLTVGVVALPLAMAFAIASGTTPDRGLFTAVVAGFLISALGGSRFQIGGPTGAFVVIIFSVIQRHGYDGLVACTLLAGVMLVVLGLCRMGALIQYIPYPVTTGFTAGIGVLIFSSQMKDFLGIQAGPVPSEFLAKWAFYLQNLGSIHAGTLVVSLIALGCILAVRRYAPRVPAPVVGVAVASVCALLFHTDSATIGSAFGGIPDTLPAFSFPHISMEKLRDIFPDALAIALLAGIESLLSCVVADGMTGERHKPDAELVAQGVANIFSVSFGGIPATGAIARTATNIKSGAVSPVSGMIHSLTLLCFILFLSGVASYITLASLAAVLVVVAWDMSEVHKFMRLFKAPRSDIFVMLTTFGLTIAIDLTVAVLVGVVLAAILFMKRMSEVTGFSSVENGSMENVEGIYAGGVEGKDIQAYEIDGPFFFGVADRFRTTMNSMQQQPRVFILRMERVPTIDSTGIFALESFITRCRADGSTVLLSGVNRDVASKLRKMGTLNVYGGTKVFADYESALKQAMELVSES